MVKYPIEPEKIMMPKIPDDLPEYRTDQPLLEKKKPTKSFKAGNTQALQDQKQKLTSRKSSR